MLIIQKNKYQRSEILHNLQSYYNINSGNGFDWYTEAYQFCVNVGKKYSVNPIKVAGIVAALSPQKNWPENKRIAIEFIMTGHTGQYGSLLDKAKKILKLAEDSDLYLNIFEILHGPKISSFFMNICTSEPYVTIDRHIIAAAVGYSYGTITPKGYEYLTGCIIELALENNVHPKVFQAVVWSNYRDIHVRKFEDKVPF